MNTDKLKRIREVVKAGGGDETRSGLIDDCTVLILLDILEKGHGEKAFNLLTAAFPKDMKEPLAAWIKQKGKATIHTT